MPNSGAPEATKSKKRRSPNFPGISLNQAVDRAAVLWNREKTAPAHQSIIMRHWNYAPKSSSGMIAIGALRAFGLLEAKGKALALTPLALEILRPDSTTRAAAIQKAALMPKIHSELWQEYGGHLPSPESLHFKLLEAGFTDAGATAFIKQLQDTLTFANLSEGDTLSPEEPEETGDNAATNGKTPPPGRSVTPPRGGAGMNQAILPLRSGQAIVQWPQSMSESEISHFNSWVDMLKLMVAEAKISGPPEDEE